MKKRLMTMALVCGVFLSGAGNVIAANDYVVQKGDTLYSLAKKNNTTVQNLQELNNLNSHLIFTGQKLVVQGTPIGENSGLSLTLQKNFTYEKEEPGKDLLFYQKDGHYFTRIEVLGSKIDLKEEKLNAKSYLATTGKVKTGVATNNSSFYKAASLHLHAFNETDHTTIVIKLVKGQYVKFTIHHPNKKENDNGVKTMLEILSSIK